MKRVTFIEVIVIISLLCIIAALLLPALQRPKSRGCHMPNCTSNMKQLGNAGALYEGDNAGVRPGPQPLGAAIDSVAWDRPLGIQMGANLGSSVAYEPLANLTKVPMHAAAKTLAIFTCPADLQSTGSAIGTGAKTIAEGTAAGSYITRSYMLNLGSGNLVTGVDDGVAFTENAIPVSKVESGAGTVNLIENHGYATVFGQKNLLGDTVMTCSKAGALDPADSFTNAKAPAMHGVKTKIRVNALMYDGHVEMLEQTSITATGGQIMHYVK
jgi:prepilin-type processing-associated H-X9-DG protein